MSISGVSSTARKREGWNFKCALTFRYNQAPPAIAYIQPKKPKPRIPRKPKTSATKSKTCVNIFWYTLKRTDSTHLKNSKTRPHSKLTPIRTHFECFALYCQVFFRFFDFRFLFKFSPKKCVHCVRIVYRPRQPLLSTVHICF